MKEKILSKEQYAYKFNVDPKLFKDAKEISKFALWFNYLKKNNENNK